MVIVLILVKKTQYINMNITANAMKNVHMEIIVNLMRLKILI